MATTKITNPELFDLASLDTALQLPSGTTAERPTSPSTGEWRYNTDNNLIEYYDGGSWRELQSEEIPPIPSENFNVVLYTGNGSTQSITGVGFKPDFVWVKHRNDGTAHSHNLADSTRGGTKIIYTNTTDAQQTISSSIQTFDTNGFTVGSNAAVNNNGINYVAWCWKANGGTTTSVTGTNITSATQQINTSIDFSITQFTEGSSGTSVVPHGLSGTPDMYIVKRTGGPQDWYVWHNGLSAGNSYIILNSSAAQGSNNNMWTQVDSTNINLGPWNTEGGGTKIIYAFKNVEGFSSFGSYTGNGSTAGPIVNTGFEPAYIMIKNSTAVYEWTVYDNKRSPSNPRDNVLYPNTGGAENSGETGDIDFLSNGFQLRAAAGSINQNGGTIIYAAFASDPSAAPVLADSFDIQTYNMTGGSDYDLSFAFKPQFVVTKTRDEAAHWSWGDIIRGNNSNLSSNNSDAVSTTNQWRVKDWNAGATSVTIAQHASINTSNVSYAWKANPTPTINTDGTIQSIVSANQASGFSIVSYTGDGANGTVGHGLGVAPEIVLVKRLNSTGNWSFNGSVGGLTYGTNKLLLNTSDAITSDTNEVTAATSTTFTAGTSGSVGGSGGTYIAYCFTSISGFSKIGTYTGTGATHAITGVGFQPDWIMGKEVDGVDSWEIVDSARGINKMVYANGSNAEVTNTNFTSFDSDGFTLSSATSINQSGQTYIYMAYKENPSPVVPAGQMAYLVVAGGASGGGTLQWGGGGGAGGFRTSFGTTSGGGSSSESDITLAAGTYTVTIGAGGAAQTTNDIAGNNGSDSLIAKSGLTTITSIAGGKGAGRFTGTLNTDPAGIGGSGGGGIGNTNMSSNIGAAGTANQGYAGGSGGGNSNQALGGGGGGAGSVGQNGANDSGGNGGSSLNINITGSTVAYAGGGGAGTYSSSNQGSGGGAGAGSGGRGDGVSPTTGGSATANTGSGGGGGGVASTGAGGSGVVILRLRTTDYSGSTTGSPTVTTVGTETVLTFTGSGTYVHS